MKIIYKSHWENMNDDDLIVFKKFIFDYYRNKGFPYFPIPDREKDGIQVNKSPELVTAFPQAFRGFCKPPSY